MIIEKNIVVGGMLLGLSTGIMLLIRGRILGCSGMIYRSIDALKGRKDYDSIFFVLGVLISGIIYNATQTVTDPMVIFKINDYYVFSGGLLVGIGTYLANGCTSGHGLCGMALLRRRSFVAVSIFFPGAIITSWLVH